MAAFGNAAIDIEQLEKEIAAKEEARRSNRPEVLTGHIGGSELGMSYKHNKNKASVSETIGPLSESSKSTAPRRGPMQEVNLDSELDTLDEPVWDTIKRDLRTVGAKFGHVILPHGDKEQLLKDWDLWGPLFICVGLSLLLQHNTSDGHAPQFTQVFTITFFGAIVVTANIKLLGGKISFFQSICVIGYCLLPPLVSALVCSTLLHQKVFYLRLLLTGIGFCWSTYAAMGFLAGCQPEKKKLLVIYPVFLFYFVISWMIISHS